MLKGLYVFQLEDVKQKKQTSKMIQEILEQYPVSDIESKFERWEKEFNRK